MNQNERIVLMQKVKSLIEPKLIPYIDLEARPFYTLEYCDVKEEVLIRENYGSLNTGQVPMSYDSAKSCIRDLSKKDLKAYLTWD